MWGLYIEINNCTDHDGTAPEPILTDCGHWGLTTPTLCASASTGTDGRLGARLLDNAVLSRWQGDARQPSYQARL
jgi:hypothetical protein